MFILVNLKAYDCDPVAIAAAVHDVATATGIRMGVAPQPTHLASVISTGVETWAQHVDPNLTGSHTGSVSAAPIADIGATGTLLNHSERRLRLATIDACLDSARSVDLETVVCANDPTQIAAATALGPDIVAVEPPELIGSGTPVSKADPDIVRDAVDAANSIDPSVHVLCGAGISTGDDVAAARELGADGVLLASGVAKAAEPTSVLEDLVSDV